MKEKLNIYFGHSKKIDYQKIYDWIESCEELKKYNFMFPHKLDSNSRNGRDFYKNIDVFIAEISFPSTGLGIELGFSFDEKIPIYCFYKENSNYTNALLSVTNNFIEYTAREDFLKKLIKILNEYENSN